MDEEQEYKRNIGLIYLTIKQLHLYWQTDDEFQDYVDAGTDGLIKGIRTYDLNKNIKKSTYYFSCIKHEILHLLTYKNTKKNKVEIVSYNKVIGQEGEQLIDFLASDINLEQELLNEERKETIIQAINSLPIEKDRYVIKFLYGLDGYEKLNMTQLGERWGCNKNAIMFRKNRALGQLWHKLRRYYYEDRL